MDANGPTTSNPTSLPLKPILKYIFSRLIYVTITNRMSISGNKSRKITSSIRGTTTYDKTVILKCLEIFLNSTFILYSMRGKTKCPHCDEKVIVEVPDGATGEQITQCTNCGAEFKVNVDEKYSWEEKTPIVLPSLHLKPRSSKPTIVGILLLIIGILGIIVSAALIFAFDIMENAHIKGTFEGEVIDVHGDPLEGVTVSVHNHPEITDMTDSNGKFSLPNITSGKQVLHLTKAGYKAVNIELIALPWNIQLEKIVMKEGVGETSEESVLIQLLHFAPLLSGILLISSIITLIGGVAALMKKHLLLALLGCIFGIIAGFFTLLGIPLAIAALILLLLSREEFEARPKEVKY